MDNALDFPVASKAVLSNVYMDDYLGCPSCAAISANIYRYLIKLLARGGFHLTKFVSNCTQVSEALKMDNIETSAIEKEVVSQKIFSRFGFEMRSLQGHVISESRTFS